VREAIIGRSTSKSNFMYTLLFNERSFTSQHYITLT